MQALPQRVKMVDVGPRDGLQNEPGVVATEAKVELIDRLSDAGLPAVEATSFVSPKWVPQMADASEVMARIRRKPGVSYPVLVPNMKGLDAALAARVEEIAVFGAGTLAFAAAGAGWVAVVVGVLAALHLVATFPLGQRRPWVDAKPA